MSKELETAQFHDERFATCTLMVIGQSHREGPNLQCWAVRNNTMQRRHSRLVLRGGRSAHSGAGRTTSGSEDAYKVTGASCGELVAIKFVEPCFAGREDSLTLWESGVPDCGAEVAERQEDRDRSKLKASFLPKEPICEVCRHTNVIRAPCRRNVDDRTDIAKQTERFGHEILHENQQSRMHRTCAVAVQHLATQWI